MDDTIKLIKVFYGTDSIGQKTESEISREVLTELRGISRSEFNSAGQLGLKPSMVAVMPYVNYDGENVCEWRGERYAVYRAYHSFDEIELYLEKKAGC